MKYNFPIDADYYFVLNSIGMKFGGLTRAMLRRAKLFEGVGIVPEILTFNYNHQYDTVREGIYNEQLIPKTVKITNMYECLANDISVNTTPINHKIEDEDYIIEPVKNRHCFRYFKNGMYTMYKSFEGKDGCLKFIDYFDKHHYKVEREEFDSFGIKRRHQYVDYLNSMHSPRQELYYNRKGECYLNIWYKTVDGKKVVERIHYFEDSQVKAFSNFEGLHKYWLDKYLSNQKKSFLIVDGRAMDSVVLKLKEPHIYKTFIFHSTHLREPYHFDSVIRLGNRTVFNNFLDVDGLVLLTNKQRKDVIERYGDKKNTSVIPHSIDLHKIGSINQNKRDQYRGVMIARYHEEKRIDHVIRAYEKVVKVIPQATLEIYGFGEEEASLNALINKLKLNNNVFLKGFSNDTDTLYQSASFSILTSKYEGFGMSLVESLAQGCPLVCYNIKYGPSDMIDDGRNGFLVKDGDIDELATKIIKLISNKDLINEFSKEARLKAGEFSNDQFLEKWSNHFNEMVERKNKDCSITYKLINIQKLEKEYTYTFEGAINFNSYEELQGSTVGLIFKDKRTKEIIEIISDENVINKDKIQTTVSLNNYIPKLKKGELWEIYIFFRGENTYVENIINIAENKQIPSTLSEHVKEEIVSYIIEKDTGICLLKISDIKKNNENGLKPKQKNRRSYIKRKVKAVLKRINS